MRIWLAMVLVLLAPALAGAQQLPSWDMARQAMVDDYAKEQPKDKVLEVTGPQRRELGSKTLRYYGAALLAHADGTRSRDLLWVQYKLLGDNWVLEHVQIMERSAQADVTPPSTEQALRLLKAAWPKDKCEGFDILDVTLDNSPPRYQQETTADRAHAKRWYVYRVRVAARGNGKFRMSEDGADYINETQNLLRWNPDDKSWSVEPQQLRCSFSKRR
jgi:hypothetical protein